MQVGTVPDDWECYRRAEVIPIGGNCTVAGRATLLADSSNGAADVASEAAAALATAAVLLGPKDPAFAKKALNTAHSLYDYANLYPVRIPSPALARYEQLVMALLAALIAD
ncbi:MAG: hypothetical protein HC767_14175 [Akkermansiaceae bacterium]|nr:hypothetical protein [Akkermansiaceae bacterium]